MCALRWLMAMVLALLATTVSSAQAATRVDILETWPRGTDVVLARNQDFYVRLAYATDRPVHIWARPYFQGRPANAGSNPSGEYNGSGETLGWFFLARPDVRVDEIRITAGDGRPASTPQVADLRVKVSGSDRVGSIDPEPAWVTSMRAAEANAERQDYEARMRAPTRPGDFVLFQAFMLAVALTFLLAFGWPIWACWKWRGGWRLAAMVPAAVMAFVSVRLFVDTARDPTTHNLWPFEMLMFGLPCAAVMVLLAVARRMTAKRAAKAPGMPSPERKSR